MPTVQPFGQRGAFRSPWQIAAADVIELACDLYRAGFGTLDDCLTEARAWIARRARAESRR